MNLRIKVIIGLGNPDKKYENTYHNIGFLFIDYLNRDPKLRIHPNLQIFKSENYMNESGIFVTKIIKKFGVKPRELLIVHDDSDIELGKYKLSFGRGSAGHKGIESIINSLGTKNFWRLRIGIRSFGKISVNQRTDQRKSVISRRKASEIVLKKISEADQKTLEKVFEEVLTKTLKILF